MAGQLSFEELKSATAAGEIDTVLILDSVVGKRDPRGIGIFRLDLGSSATLAAFALSFFGAPVQQHGGGHEENR